jgi:hypothetical protein
MRPEVASRPGRPGAAALRIRSWQRGSEGEHKHASMPTAPTPRSTRSSLASRLWGDVGRRCRVPSVPSGPGPFGLRVTGWSRLLVQPPNPGPMFNSVTVVYGTVEIKVTNDTEGHDAVLGLT